MGHEQQTTDSSIACPNHTLFSNYWQAKTYLLVPNYITAIKNKSNARTMLQYVDLQ